MCFTCLEFLFLDFQSVPLSEKKLKSLNQWIESFKNKAETFIRVQKILDENTGNIRARINNFIECYVVFLVAALKWLVA